MTNPAEKIRQVVEEQRYKVELCHGFFSEVAVQIMFEDYTAKLLDAIIAWYEMKAETVYQDHPNEAAHIQHGRIAAHLGSAKELKEARTSITNSTHE